MQDYADQFTLLKSIEESSMNKNLNHVFDLANMTRDYEKKIKASSKELSVDIVDKTPSTKKIFKKRRLKKIEGCFKDYDKGGNPLKKMTGTCTAYDPFDMVDKTKADWLYSWMTIERLFLHA